MKRKEEEEGEEEEDDDVNKASQTLHYFSLGRLQEGSRFVLCLTERIKTPFALSAKRLAASLGLVTPSSLFNKLGALPSLHRAARLSTSHAI